MDPLTSFLIPLAALASAYVLVLFLPWSYSFLREGRDASCVAANGIMLAAIVLIWRGALA